MKIFVLIFFGLIATSFGTGSEDESTSSYYSYSTSSEEIEERITGGNVMQNYELAKFNYQVGLISLTVRGTTLECGGALIHEHIVLSAAHCFVDVVEVGIFMGTTVKPDGISSCEFVVPITYVRVHKDFTMSRLLDDIATVYLPSPARLSKYIGIIPLASYRWTDCETGNAWVSGWGYISDGVLSKDMNYAQVTPLRYEECHDRYSVIVRGKQLCTTHENNKGTCGGDSGGPYAFEDYYGNRYLCGLNSFSFSWVCADSTPRAKTGVAYYHDNGWICENSYGLVGC